MKLDAATKKFLKELIDDSAEVKEEYQQLVQNIKEKYGIDVLYNQDKEKIQLLSEGKKSINLVAARQMLEDFIGEESVEIIC